MALAVCLDTSGVATGGQAAVAAGQIREAVVVEPVAPATIVSMEEPARHVAVRASGAVVGAPGALAVEALVVWASTAMAGGEEEVGIQPPTVPDWVCLAAVVAAWKATLARLVALVRQIVVAAAVVALSTLSAVLVALAL
jgi:hypothetical protein